MFLMFADVHNAEFVLTGVLTQTLDYESYPFCVKAVCCLGKCRLLEGLLNWELIFYNVLGCVMFT